MPESTEQRYGWVIKQEEKGELELIKKDSHHRACYSTPDGTGEVWVNAVSSSSTKSPYGTGTRAQCIGPVGGFLGSTRPPTDIFTPQFDHRHKKPIEPLNDPTQVPFKQFMTRTPPIPVSLPTVDWARMDLPSKDEE